MFLLDLQNNLLNSKLSVPQDGFLLGCVFAIADYPEQMADKQLLATWKRVRHSLGCCGPSWNKRAVACVVVEPMEDDDVSKVDAPELLPQVIQACGGAVDTTLTSRCTHLLCESQVSNMYVQVRLNV